jgi:hypothetical protein
VLGTFVFFWDIVMPVLLREELGEAKRVARIRTMKKIRQHNGEKKKYKRTNTIYKTYI